MRCQALETLLILWAASLGEAFTGAPFSSNVRSGSGAKSLSKTHVAMSTSSQSGFGTRGDMIKAVGGSVAGVLGSAMLPAGALAEADQQRKGEVILRLATCIPRGKLQQCVDHGSVFKIDVSCICRTVDVLT